MTDKTGGALTLGEAWSKATMFIVSEPSGKVVVSTYKVNQQSAYHPLVELLCEWMHNTGGDVDPNLTLYLLMARISTYISTNENRSSVHDFSIQPLLKAILRKYWPNVLN